MDRGDGKSHSRPPPVLDPEDLDFDGPTLVLPVPAGHLSPADSERFERLRVLEALEACDDDPARAAQLLGVSSHALRSLLEKWNLPRLRKR
jgi:transcriptional regulator with GAF, ATPase, and Fis domain